MTKKIEMPSLGLMYAFKKMDLALRCKRNMKIRWSMLVLPRRRLRKKGAATFIDVFPSNSQLLQNKRPGKLLLHMLSSLIKRERSPGRTQAMHFSLCFEGWRGDAFQRNQVRIRNKESIKDELPTMLRIIHELTFSMRPAYQSTISGHGKSWEAQIFDVVCGLPL